MIAQHFTLNSHQPQPTTSALNSNQKQQIKNSLPKLTLPTYHPLPPSELPSVFHKQEKQTPSSLQNDHSKRLFTFMDEHSVQRQLIQEFINKNNLRSHRASCQEVNFIEHYEKVPRESIEKIIEKSRKKREAFLKKLIKPTFTLKKDNSKSKTSRNSVITPRLPSQQKKYETIEARSKSKTPLAQTQRCLTPCYDKSNKLFINKFHPENQKIKNKIGKHYHDGRNKGKKDKKEQGINNDETSAEHRKELIKKKKELEKELTAINESLLFCKKKQQKKIKSKQPIQIQNGKAGSKGQGRHSMRKLTKLL